VAGNIVGALFHKL